MRGSEGYEPENKETNIFSWLFWVLVIIALSVWITSMVVKHDLTITSEHITIPQSYEITHSGGKVEIVAYVYCQVTSKFENGSFLVECYNEYRDFIYSITAVRLRLLDD